MMIHYKHTKTTSLQLYSWEARYYFSMKVFSKGIVLTLKLQRDIHSNLSQTKQILKLHYL